MGTASRKEHHREVVDVADLADDGVLADRTFVDCHILGPAVIAPLEDVDFDRCRFDTGPEALFWPIDQDRYYIGAVSLRNVAFAGCRFEFVGIAALPETIAMMTSEFKRADASR